jgi:hypothetical protein
MADLVIRKSDGWMELDALTNAIDNGFNVFELWNAVGQGNHDEALNMLSEAGFELADEWSQVRMMSLPDDIRGEFFRVWVK